MGILISKFVISHHWQVNLNEFCLSVTLQNDLQHAQRQMCIKKERCGFGIFCNYLG